MAAKGKTLKFFTAITLIVIVAFIAAPLAASCNILDRKPHYDFKPCKISKPHYGVSEKIPSIVLLEKHDFTRQTLGSNGCWLRQLHQTDQIVYSGLNIIAEYNAGSSATSPGNEYIYSGGIDSLTMVAFNNNSKRLSAFRNHQWSIVGLVDFDTQALEEQYAYNVFGERTILDSAGTVLTSSSFNNRYGYTSREHDDETGVMYYRARMFDSATGEFISKDPLEYVDGASMYRGYFVPDGVDPKGTGWTATLTKIDFGNKCSLDQEIAMEFRFPENELPNPRPTQAWFLNVVESFTLNQNCKWKRHSYTVIDVYGAGNSRRNDGKWVMKDTSTIIPFAERENCITIISTSKVLGFNTPPLELPEGTNQGFSDLPPEQQTQIWGAMRGPGASWVENKILIEKANCKNCLPCWLLDKLNACVECAGFPSIGRETCANNPPFVGKEFPLPEFHF